MSYSLNHLNYCITTVSRIYQPALGMLARFIVKHNNFPHFRLQYREGKTYTSIDCFFIDLFCSGMTKSLLLLLFLSCFLHRFGQIASNIPEVFSIFFLYCTLLQKKKKTCTQQENITFIFSTRKRSLPSLLCQRLVKR